MENDKQQAGKQAESFASSYDSAEVYKNPRMVSAVCYDTTRYRYGS